MQNTLKILVAEDEEDLLDTYKMVFDSKNYETILTKNGQECIEMYKKELQKIKDSSITPFDVVILDHKMPKKNGFDVAKEILEISPCQRIIFASAFAKDILEQSINEQNLGIELLQKPFDLDSLIDKIEDKEIYSRLQEFGIGKMQPKKIQHDNLLRLKSMLDNIEQQYLH